MSEYYFLISKKALKELQKIPKPTINKIKDKLLELRTNPFLSGAKKLAGTNNCFRLRQGDYRILYFVENKSVKITNISHHREAYR
jgi:mRNA interferase RelE/StbE